MNVVDGLRLKVQYQELNEMRGEAANGGMLWADGHGDSEEPEGLVQRAGPGVAGDVGPLALVQFDGETCAFARSEECEQDELLMLDVLGETRSVVYVGGKVGLTGFSCDLDDGVVPHHKFSAGTQDLPSRCRR